MKISCKVVIVALVVSMMFIGYLTPRITYSAEPNVWVYAKLPHAPEGVCFDSKNNLYTTLHNTGESRIGQ